MQETFVQQNPVRNKRISLYKQPNRDNTQSRMAHGTFHGLLLKDETLKVSQVALTNSMEG